MYLLDASVIWPLRNRVPDARDEPLFEWVGKQIPTTLFVSAITMFEFENGARILERTDKPAGVATRMWVDTRLRPAFEGRIIAIDDAVVRRWAHLGYSDFSEGILTATALQHGLIIATRDAGNFRAGKAKTVNPWSYTPDADDLDWRRASRTAPIWLKSLFVRA